MIQLRFNTLSGAEPALLGPSPFFRIEGTLLQQGAECSVVGRYRDHHWEMADRFVSSYEFVEPVCLQFEDAAGGTSQPYGPFQHVRFPNGSCYADGALFAELVDEPDPEHPTSWRRGRWVHRPDSTRWPTLWIRPPRSPG